MPQAMHKIRNKDLLGSKVLTTCLTLLFLTAFFVSCSSKETSTNAQEHNTLTKKESDEGWTLLFDGKTRIMQPSVFPQISGNSSVCYLYSVHVRHLSEKHPFSQASMDCSFYDRLCCCTMVEWTGNDLSCMWTWMHFTHPSSSAIVLITREGR